MSFWVYFHGESLLVVWRINSDLTRDIVYATSSSSFEQDVWHEINLALDVGTIYPMKVCEVQKSVTLISTIYRNVLLETPVKELF